MAREILISVIVPVYNTEEYLEECINSILAQTIPFYEIVLVNDGATDCSGKICEKFCEQHENIHLIEQINKGLGNARNQGMKKATGDYVLFVDSDDAISGEMNEVLCSVLSMKPVDVVYYAAEIKNDMDGNFMVNSYVRNKKLCNKKISGKEFFLKSYPKHNIASACCAAYRKEYLLKNRILFPEGIYYEDNIFSLTAALNANDIWCVENQLYIRRYRKNSITMSTITKKKCQDRMTMQYEIWKILKTSDLLCDHTNIVKKYIISYVLGLKDMLEQYGEATGKEAEYVECFIRYWERLWDYENIGWNDIYPLMCLRKLGKGGNKENSESCRQFFSEVEMKAKNLVESKLKKLPLQERKRIGIYGLGKHTEVLLKWYEDLLGAIDAEIYFIVSKKTIDTFMRKEIVEVNEIPFDTDAIIISSKRYEEEMKSKLQENQVDFCEIITIYDSEDEYDLPAIDEVL